MSRLWPSPITADLLVSGAIGISEVVADGTDVYWAENRPSEAGRAAVVRWRDGTIEEVTGPDVNVRTRVHEYGGGAWWVAGGRLVYSDDARSGELFILDLESGDERKLTSSGHRYADGRFSNDGAWYICVRETHDGDDHRDVENMIVAVRTDGSVEHVVASGHDFYSSPRIAPDGTIAFVAWDHPNMPWDTTMLHVGTFDGTSGAFDEVPSDDESIVMPDWTADGRLLGVTDRSNWWNLVEFDPATGAQKPIVEGEFEIGMPAWVFGLNRWCETPDGFVVVAGSALGDTIVFPSGFVENRHTSVSSIRSLGNGRVVYAASSFSEESAVWMHDGAAATRLSSPRDLGLDDAYFTPPEFITFDVTAVDLDAGANAVAHALFYAPASPEFVLTPTLDVGHSTNIGEGASDSGGLPPLLVIVHGGPTSAARRQLSLATRFWTSRGVAVVDVDHRGSTGYGRAFRRELEGGWGHVDAADAVAAARHLADEGLVDPDRMVIAGGSAGGLTVLNALAHYDVFGGGVSRYGCSDLLALADGSHKFESRSMDWLVGPLPDDEALYIDRSPITHIDRITSPMLVLQGLDDVVVPPDQSEKVVDALRTNGIPVTYLEFEGEGHGFRRAETITTALDAELEFIDSL